MDVVGAGTDPARVLQVCVDGAPSCHQARIDPRFGSTNPNASRNYPCGGPTDPDLSCLIAGDTVYVNLHLGGEVVSQAYGRQVEVTATGGSSRDQHAAGTVEQLSVAPPCHCPDARAQVHLTTTS